MCDALSVLRRSTTLCIALSSRSGVFCMKKKEIKVGLHNFHPGFDLEEGHEDLLSQYGESVSLESLEESNLVVMILMT